MTYFTFPKKFPMKLGLATLDNIDPDPDFTEQNPGKFSTFFLLFFQVIFSLANIIFASPFGRFLNRNNNNDGTEGMGLRIMMEKKSQYLPGGTFDLCAS